MSEHFILHTAYTNIIRLPMKWSNNAVSMINVMSEVMNVAVAVEPGILLGKLPKIQ